MVRSVSKSCIFYCLNYSVSLLFLSTIIFDICLYKYKSCEFDIQEIRGDVRYEVSILKYQIADNFSNCKLQLSEYYLVKSGSDTLNVIAPYYGSRSDSTIRKYRYSTNWVLMPKKDTACFEFYSFINLKKAIDNKYPILFGQIVIGID